MILAWIQLQVVGTAARNPLLLVVWIMPSMMEIKNFPVDTLLAKKGGKTIRNITTCKCSSRLSLIVPV